VVQPAVSAVLTGNTATYGSSGPFQFIYGTVIVDSGNSCPPSQFENTNYILAVQNDMTLGSCGLGGVVTSIQSSTAYSVPYLVYANSNVINYIGNGTTLLLDGPGLELLNISGLQRSIFSGYYYGSSFAPSYLAWAQNNASTKSPNGLYSFDLYNRQVPQFSTNAINSINVNQIFSVTSGRLNFSLSLWFAPKSQISSYSSSVLAKQVFFNLNITGSSIDFGSPCSTTISSVPINGIVFPNTWHNIVVTYNSTGVSTSNAYIYLDGVRVGSGSFSLCGSSSANFVIGGGQTPFSGSISNIQAYNSVLSSYQAARLYYEGIEGIAVPSKLVGWWPLNGNANDISGRGYNGNVIGTPTYQYLYGYSGDPIYDGSFYSGNLTNAVEGAYNCANINQCSNFSLQHLYLGQASLSSIIGGSKTEAASLGVGNALIPNVGSFNGNGYVSGNLIGYYDGGSGPYTFSAWAYVNSTTNGPVISLCAGNAFGSCTSTPVISISQSIIYANNGGSLSYSVTNPNSWHNIVVTYSSGTKNLYVDGISEGSVSGTLQVNGAGPVFWTTKTLSGKIADVQFFSNSLSAAQVSQLYLNDTVKGAAPTDRIPLSVGYNGLMNQSINSANALNPAFFANNNGACSNANVIDYICGAVYSQP
jgi:hypothetical protein